VANGSLGSNETLLLPAGNYRVEFDSAPRKEVQISLTPRDQLTLTLQKRGDLVSHFERHNRLQSASCEPIKRFPALCLLVVRGRRAYAFPNKKIHSSPLSDT
jgi:hypothetical protein